MKTDNYNQSKTDHEDGLEKHLDFKKVFVKIGRRWPWLLVSVIAGILIAISLNRYTTPIYIVESSLLIKAPKEVTNSVSDLLYGEEFFGRNATNLENESILFKSYNLIDKTLRDLKLNISYFEEGDIHNIELYKKSPLSVEIDTSSTRIYNGLPIRINLNKDSTFTLEVVDTKSSLFKKNKRVEAFNALLQGKVFAVGEVVDMKGFKFKVILTPKPGQKKLKKVLFIAQPYERLKKLYRRSLRTSPVGEKSSILSISIEGPTPAKLIDFLNQLIQNYIGNELTQKNERASKTIQFIDNQILYMSDSLNIVEARLETFKKSNRSTDINDDGSALYSDMRELEKEKSILDLEMTYLKDLESSILSDQGGQLVNPSSLGISDGTLNEATKEYSAIQLNLDVIDPDKKLNNPLIKQNQDRLRALKSTILESIRGLKQKNEVKINSLNSSIGGLKYYVRNLPTAERELINIQRNYDLSEDLYLFLMQKRAEAGIAKASNSKDYVIVDDPIIKGTLPVKPSPSLNYSMGIICGLVFPSIVILLIEIFNNKVSSKEELLKLSGLPLSGLVVKNKKGSSFVANEDSKSPLTESFRTIRSNLRYLVENDSQHGKILLVTSSMSGEGKTFCSNNLAYIFSNYGKKVLLVNCDMRKYNDHTIFGVEENVGLSDYLAGIASKEKVVQSSMYENLDVIVPGGIPPNPTELILSERMGKMLKEFRYEYEYIILDTPPIGIISDGLELMDKSDVNIYVVRENYTLKKQILEANEIYKNRKIKNLTMILNDVKLKEINYGYGYLSNGKSNKKSKSPISKKNTILQNGSAHKKPQEVAGNE
ncbi:polysaccharide biosynthesis tyrosine autokinase [Fulvivirgaceae bacterium BMA12]|uniref:non-specific protein-tyrosine kinase n=1 Tax=Agaribacillus aureus TaxID=3051825 RepID=A0ABT8L8V9_9BACT|nr:polysaccharide biosynthesis tyrosine autokinase [Fulvivirgaceae bacterium BMA12]